MLSHELDEVADLLGTTLAYVGANNDQVRAMATSWPHDLASLVTDHDWTADHFTHRVLKRHAQVSLRPVDSPPAHPCECEHTAHWTDRDHDYRKAQAGARRARYVGPVCDHCADGHMADYLV